MTDQANSSLDCADCRVSRPNFFSRYRDFLLSRDTLLTFANAGLLLVGFVISVFGAPEVGQ
jgi:hypothetical protein